jgi:hypothetical protein
MTRFNMAAFAQAPPGGRLSLPLPAPELYDMVTDPDEGNDRGDRNPGTVASIRAQVDAQMKTFPSDIQDAWHSTLATPAGATPSGCYPVPAGS